MKTLLTLSLAFLLCVIAYVISLPNPPRQITYSSKDIPRLESPGAIRPVIKAVDESTGKEVLMWQGKNGEHITLTDGSSWRTE